MAKKKIEEETIEGTEPDTVEVAMTPAQRDEFVEFMRKKEVAPAVEPVRMATIHCVFIHNINGVKYGPGRVRCDENIAGTLAYGEQKQKEAEIGLYMSNKRLKQIFESGNAVPVMDDNVLAKTVGLVGGFR